MARAAKSAINPLQDPTAALRFLIEFAQLDFDTIEPEPYLRAIKGLDDFINRESPGAGRQHLDDKHLAYFQTRAWRVLETLVTTQRFTVADDVVLSYWLLVEGSKLRRLVMGAPLSRFLDQVIRVLERVDVSRLKKCDATDCGRLFVRVTQKKFCSTRCQSRVYMRTQRAIEHAERLAFIAKQQKGSRRDKTTR